MMPYGAPGTIWMLASSMRTISPATGSGRAEERDDYFVYNEKTGVLSFDADGSGRGHAVELATIVGHPEVNAHDIVLV